MRTPPCCYLSGFQVALTVYESPFLNGDHVVWYSLGVDNYLLLCSSDAISRHNGGCSSLEEDRVFHPSLSSSDSAFPILKRFPVAFLIGYSHLCDDPCPGDNHIALSCQYFFRALCQELMKVPNFYSRPFGNIFPGCSDRLGRLFWKLEKSVVGGRLVILPEKTIDDGCLVILLAVVKAFYQFPLHLCYWGKGFRTIPWLMRPMFAETFGTIPAWAIPPSSQPPQNDLNGLPDQWTRRYKASDLSYQPPFPSQCNLRWGLGLNSKFSPYGLALFSLVVIFDSRLHGADMVSFRFVLLFGGEFSFSVVLTPGAHL
ncbi:hypothetical protein Tco_0511096 [Tanacetum coccineum]|uniref:Uncharacterized protein n=1 Tax=Tanacetum coccineum TaxID=301880 RepID=A0ABQ4XV00_9ASTR